MMMKTRRRIKKRRTSKITSRTMRSIISIMFLHDFANCSRLHKSVDKIGSLTITTHHCSSFSGSSSSSSGSSSGGSSYSGSIVLEAAVVVTVAVAVEVDLQPNHHNSQLQ